MTRFQVPRDIELQKYEVFAATPGDKFLVGRSLSYADLSMFQLVAGLRYAFPNAMAGLEADLPLTVTLYDRVAARPRIKAYLASECPLAAEHRQRTPLDCAAHFRTSTAFRRLETGTPGARRSPATSANRRTARPPVAPRLRPAQFPSNSRAKFPLLNPGAEYRNAKSVSTALRVADDRLLFAGWKPALPQARVSGGAHV